MDERTVFLVFALVTIPWWGRLAARLGLDLWSASAPTREEPTPRARARRTSAPPLTARRSLAFQSTGRPTRPRWEGGFGRRHP